MPARVHTRAEHILRGNPTMSKGEAFAIANKQLKDKTAEAFFDELTKIALAERLIRLGATDIPGTPRMLMRKRSPEQLAALQHGITNNWADAVAPIKDRANALAQRVPTSVGKSIARHGMHTVIDNPEALAAFAAPLPGVTESYLFAKKGLEKAIDRVAPLRTDLRNAEDFRKVAPTEALPKVAFMSAGKYLLGQIGKPKVKHTNANPPNAENRVKEGMFPTSPEPMGSTGMAAQKTLMKSQSTGTPDDKNGLGFKPINTAGKGPKVGNIPNSVGSPASTSAIKAAQLVKSAFSDSGFGPTGGVFRPQYASYLGTKEIASPIVMDPHIKHGGNAVPQKKVAFAESGFGPARSLGAYGGNGGYHQSHQGRIPIAAIIAQDPQLKQAEEEFLKKQAAIPLTPKGRLANARKKGAPKLTGFSGPSGASISKPIGYGEALPGATKA